MPSNESRTRQEGYIRKLFSEPVGYSSNPAKNSGLDFGSLGLGVAYCGSATIAAGSQAL